MRKFNLSVHYAEGFTFQVEAENEVAAQKKVESMLNENAEANIGVDKECVHREWEIVDLNEAV